MRAVRWVLAAAVGLAGGVSAGATGGWFEAVLAARGSRAASEAFGKPASLPDFGEGTYTIAAWVRTRGDGTILAKTVPGRPWPRGGKSLFLRGGKVCFDVGFLGCVTGRTNIADGRWHHVAFTGGRPQRIYIDGRLDAEGDLDAWPDPPGSAIVLGYTASNFPSPSALNGALDDVQVHAAALAAEDIADLAGGRPCSCGVAPAAHWPLDGDTDDASGGRNDGVPRGRIGFTAGRIGRALAVRDQARVVIPCPSATGATQRLFADLRKRFGDEASRREMAWEAEDGIWGDDFRRGGQADIARRYLAAAKRHGAVGPAAAGAVLSAPGGEALRRARALYLAARRRAALLAELDAGALEALRGAVARLYGDGPVGAALRRRLEGLEARAAAWAKRGAAPPAEALETWKADLRRLRRDVLVTNNPLFDFDEIVFVKRYTYNANHYYTEYINSDWVPGGDLCVLNLRTGHVRRLAPQLEGGVFGRFDVSFDARRVVFAWKRAWQEGYRLYEVGTDGRGLRQLTFPQDNEKWLVERYRARPHYHHGTDDMHPCYLPDGGICFISTRCRYGILCDAPDDFTTTVLYRIDPPPFPRRVGPEDVASMNLHKLTNSSVSEASPVMMPDGRILYTRWEYFDKGAVSLKCLWAVRPDGSCSAEIYAADIALPPTFIYARPIPGSAEKYVVLGTPHCPQNGMGTVIRLDMNHSTRTREPMTYMTPYVDIRAEGGFSFCDTAGRWRADGRGRGPLFKDPYPLSEKYFLVSHKPAGPVWTDPKGYGIYLLDEEGNVFEIYRDPEVSCWMPYPLKPRRRPPVLSKARSEELARRNQAVCIVRDVYRGLTGVERGTIRYIRVLEQIPRPWETRRRWGGDCYDQQHAVITKDTHLGLKVQWGIVPVEDDGSAHFLVPANANVSLHVLDENFMAVQKERTYVNYMPGETRSCVGCHEIPTAEVPAPGGGIPKALLRPPSVPGPQPGEKTGRRPLHYPTDVQPVFDRHCVECHSGEKPKAALNLSGEMTALFNVSYESLVPERRRRPRRDRGLLGPVIGENHPKTGNVHYLPARSLGSHASVLVAMLAPDKVHLADPKQAARAAELAEKHKKIRLSREELLKITNWIDTNCQYYGSYWGRRHIQYRDHPNFRPTPTFETARSMTSPIPEEQR